ncbi:MAG: hypothetical protein QOE15_2257 [Acidimicrobiaceae bacterium]|jgi:hypothetical protein|nr:hypothetical protein [Acidimicrobiaceae bacterium]
MSVRGALNSQVRVEGIHAIDKFWREGGHRFRVRDTSLRRLTQTSKPRRGPRGRPVSRSSAGATASKPESFPDHVGIRHGSAPGTSPIISSPLIHGGNQASSRLGGSTAVKSGGAILNRASTVA